MSSTARTKQKRNELRKMIKNNTTEKKQQQLTIKESAKAADELFRKTENKQQAIDQPSVAIAKSQLNLRKPLAHSLAINNTRANYIDLLSIITKVPAGQLFGEKHNCHSLLEIANFAQKKSSERMRTATQTEEYRDIAILSYIGLIALLLDTPMSDNTYYQLPTEKLFADRLQLALTVDAALNTLASTNSFSRVSPDTLIIYGELMLIARKISTLVPDYNFSNFPNHVNTLNCVQQYLDPTYPAAQRFYNAIYQLKISQDLSKAIKSMQHHQIRFILEKHPEMINQEIPLPPLFIAITAGLFGTCQLLIELKADVNQRSSVMLGQSPLFVACTMYNPEIVACLLDNNAMLNPPNQPSIIDAFAQHLDAKKDIEKYQDAAIVTHQHTRQVLIFKLLFTATNNYNKKHLINQFTQMQREDLLALIDQPNDRAMTDQEMENKAPASTPTMILSKSKKQKKREKDQKQKNKLRELEAKVVDHMDTGNYEEALQVSEKSNRLRKKLLKDDRRAFPKKPSHEQTRFVIAITTKQVATARETFNAMAKAQEKHDLANMRKDDQTPLMIAVQNTDIATIEFLAVECCANITLTDGEDRTALHWAVKSNNLTAFQCLVKHYSRDIPRIVNLADEMGRTALHEAVQIQSPEMVATLLAQGANHRQKDKNGQRPTDIATSTEITCLLKEAEDKRLILEAEQAQKKLIEEQKKLAIKEQKEQKKEIEMLAVTTTTEAFELLFNNKRLPDREFDIIIERCKPVIYKHETVFEQDPFNKKNYVDLIKLLRRSREHTKARKVLDQLLLQFPDDMGIKYDSARNYIALGQDDIAETTLLALDDAAHKTQSPKNHMHQFYLLVLYKIYIKWRMIDKSNTTYNKLKQLNKNNLPDELAYQIACADVIFHVNKIVMQPFQLHKKSCISYITKMINKLSIQFPLKSVATLALSGWSHIKAGDFETAQKCFEALKEVDLKNHLQGLAVVHRILHKYDQSKHYYNELIAQFPKFYPARLALAALECKQQHNLFNTYIDHLTQLIKEFPYQQNSYLLLAREHWDQGNYDDAVSAYHHLFKVFPHAIEARIDYIYRELMEFHTQIALDFCEQTLADSTAKKFFSNNAQFYLAYVDALLQAEMFTKAQQIQKECAARFSSADENMIAINYNVNEAIKKSPIISEAKDKKIQAPLPAAAKDSITTKSSPKPEQHITESKTAATGQSKAFSRAYEIPNVVRSYFTVFEKANLAAVLDGYSTLHILINPYQRFTVYTNASSAFLEIECQADCISENTYLVENNDVVIEFKLLPSCTEAELIAHSQQTCFYTVLSLAMDMRGNIHWTTEAENAYRKGVLYVDPSKKTAFDTHIRQAPTELLAIPALAAEFNLTIHQTLKDQISHSTNELTTIADLQHTLRCCIQQQSGDKYRNKAYSFYVKLHECNENLIKLLFPSASTLTLQDHQDIISHLAAMENKIYTDPDGVLQDLYALIASYQHRNSYGTHQFIKNVNDQWLQYGFDTSEIDTSRLMSQILRYGQSWVTGIPKPTVSLVSQPARYPHEFGIWQPSSSSSTASLKDQPKIGMPHAP